MFRAAAHEKEDLLKTRKTRRPCTYSVTLKLKNESKRKEGISMTNANPGTRVEPTAKRMAIAFAVLGLLVLSGCASSEPPPAAQQAALAQTELHFDLGKCQQLGAGLYKCPAADKPVCSPEYTGQGECVRIGPKGSVFVQSQTIGN